MGDNPLLVEINNPKELRMPSGNEIGANKKWIPGGFTKGGIPEAVIDPVERSQIIDKYVFDILKQ